MQTISFSTKSRILVSCHYLNTETRVWVRRPDKVRVYVFANEEDDMGIEVDLKEGKCIAILGEQNISIIGKNNIRYIDIFHERYGGDDNDEIDVPSPFVRTPVLV